MEGIPHPCLPRLPSHTGQERAFSRRRAPIKAASWLRERETVAEQTTTVRGASETCDTICSLAFLPQELCQTVFICPCCCLPSFCKSSDSVRAIDASFYSERSELMIDCEPALRTHPPTEQPRFYSPLVHHRFRRERERASHG